MTQSVASWNSPSPFIRLVHADWSVAPGKRWVAEARRTPKGWLVDQPRLVGPVPCFLDDLLRGPQPTLAGFDFPIGVPVAFGRQTGFNGFSQAIEAFGTGAWSRFYDVVDNAEEISLHRPFYPRVSSSAARQAHLVQALRAENIDMLRRQCERKTADRGNACSLFWTLGGNQVGKAAISGWREIVQPARRAGALLWPFEGSLQSLAAANGLVVCETYPTEAYGHIGVRFPRSASKRRQQDRREAAASLALRCEKSGIGLESALELDFANGFGFSNQGEDPFDAVMGLLGMIEVVEGRRPDTPAVTQAPEWEGWILGQAA